MSDFIVLVAEDDPDDRYFIKEGMRELAVSADLHFVEDGEELMLYLRRSEKYSDPLLSPRPALILLDLNMPRKDGRQALLEIKTDPTLMNIPVAVWTTTDDSEVEAHCRKTGAEDFVTKSSTFSSLVSSLNRLVTTYCVK